jgi:hypothetical protein
MPRNVATPEVRRDRGRRVQHAATGALSSSTLTHRTLVPTTNLAIALALNNAARLLDNDEPALAAELRAAIDDTVRAELDHELPTPSPEDVTEQLREVVGDDDLTCRMLVFTALSTLELLGMAYDSYDSYDEDDYEDEYEPGAMLVHLTGVDTNDTAERVWAALLPNISTMYTVEYVSVAFRGGDAIIAATAERDEYGDVSRTVFEGVAHTERDGVVPVRAIMAATDDTVGGVLTDDTDPWAIVAQTEAGVTALLARRAADAAVHGPIEDRAVRDDDGRAHLHVKLSRQDGHPLTDAETDTVLGVARVTLAAFGTLEEVARDHEQDAPCTTTVVYAVVEHPVTGGLVDSATSHAVRWGGVLPFPSIGDVNASLHITALA